MFIGHFAPAFAASAITSEAPKLGTLFIAAQLVDWAFMAFFMIGIEQARIDLLRVQQCGVSKDEAVALEALHPLQAGRRCQVDLLGQLDVGNAAVLLQHLQDAPVDAVEVGQGLVAGGHGVACGTGFAQDKTPVMFNQQNLMLLLRR